MNRVHGLLLAALVALAGLAVGGNALQAQDQVYHPAVIKVGGVAKVKGHLVVRDSAPKQIAGWYSKGKQIGVAEPGLAFQIVYIKDLPAFFGSGQTWVGVKWVEGMTEGSKVPATGDLEHVDGWVYYGGPNYFEMVDWSKQQELKQGQ